MHTVPTTPDDEPDPIGLAAAAQRYLNQTGVAATIHEGNHAAVMAASARLIAALTIPPPTPVTRQADGSFGRGPLRGGA